jgi:RNA polymerase sigma factor (sigma-70 family)
VTSPAAVAPESPADSGGGGHHLEDLERLYTVLRPIALRYCRDPQDAQEVIQDTVSALFLKLRDPSVEIADLRRYAAAVLKNVWLRQWRLNKKWNETLPLDPELLLVDSAVEDPWASMAQVEERADVMDIVRWLPEEDQQIVALLLDGFTFREIAGALGLSLKTVERRVRRLRDRFDSNRLRHVDDVDPGTQPARREHDDHVGRARRVRRIEQDVSERSALAKLPTRQRQVLEWSRRGYQPTMIAKILHISPNTVRVNLCHARKRLRLERERTRPQDAEVWVTRRAEAGETDAMQQLAILLEDRDRLEEAAAWLRRAVAEHAHPTIMRELARLLRRSGLTGESEDWLRHAAEAADTSAMRELAALLRALGRVDEATTWLHQAIDRGDTTAAHQLSHLLFDLNRRDEAITWLRHAAAAGHDPAVKELAELEARSA